jgi:hypothetical protein
MTASYGIEIWTATPTSDEKHSAYSNNSLHHLKQKGYYIFTTYFNIKNICILFTKCICVFCFVPEWISNYSITDINCSIFLTEKECFLQVSYLNFWISFKWTSSLEELRTDEETQRRRNYVRRKVMIYTLCFAMRGQRVKDAERTYHA